MGSAVSVTRTDHTASDLRVLAAKSADAAQVRRLLAIGMVPEGASRSDASRLTGMDRQTLRDWVHRYNQAGVEALVSRVPPGPVAKLTDAQMIDLGEVVAGSPDPKAHKLMRWRCVDLRKEIERRFSVTVNEDTIGKWLRKLKLTRLQPRPYHPKKGSCGTGGFQKNLQQQTETSAP